jgi:hypothetical protein
VVFVQYQTALQEPPDFCALYIIDHPYRYFVRHLSALENIRRRVDFIRSGRLCIILTSLMETTALVHFIRSGIVCILSARSCGLYMVWSALYNDNRPCQKSQACGRNIRSGRLCVILSGLTIITEL